MSVTVIAEQSATLTEGVRSRIEAGARVQEIEFVDMPFWFLQHLDITRRVDAVFKSRHALLAVYADGGRVLRSIPAGL